MVYAIETFGLSKEFVSFKRRYRLLSHPFQKESPALVINDITLKIRKGEIFCLIGPNGAGKTTLIKVLSCLILPTKGSAEVAGYDILKDEEKVRNAIGLVTGDERSFYWRLTGRQNIEFFAALYNLSPDTLHRRINELFDILHIEEPDKRFQEYPSGIKQRLSIVRALLNDPDILFIDELTKNLDPTSAKDLRKFIKETLVKKHGKTIIFSTHLLYEVEGLADRIGFMSKGRIVAEGELETLRKTMGNKGAAIEEVYDYFINKKG